MTLFASSASRCTHACAGSSLRPQECARTSDGRRSRETSELVDRNGSPDRSTRRTSLRADRSLRSIHGSGHSRSHKPRSAAASRRLHAKRPRARRHRARGKGGRWCRPLATVAPHLITLPQPTARLGLGQSPAHVPTLPRRCDAALASVPVMLGHHLRAAVVRAPAGRRGSRRVRSRPAGRLSAGRRPQ